MGDRSELTRLASLLTTDLAGTEVALLEAGASSEGAEAGAVDSPEGEGIEATGVAVLSPEVGAMAAPETTTAAGVRVAATVTGAQEGPTETAMTAMVSAAPKAPHCVACGGSSANPQALLPQAASAGRSDLVTVLAHKEQVCPLRAFCHRTAESV